MGVLRRGLRALGLSSDKERSEAGDSPPASTVPHSLRSSYPVIPSTDSNGFLVSGDMTVARAYRGSADGRQVYGPATQFMRGVYGPLDSPKGSTCGIKRDSCTGGGHGEAAPSNPGAARNGPVASPIPRHSASQVPPSAASPLARHIAARALRGSRPNDATPFSALSLPSLSSSPSLRVRDVGGSGGGAQSPTSPAPTTTQSPRPPTAVQAYINEPSPRARRSSTFNDATIPTAPASASPPPTPTPCPPSAVAAAPASPFTAAATASPFTATAPASPFASDRERFRGLTLQPSPQQGPLSPSPLPSPPPPARQYSSPLHALSPDYQASKSRSGRYVVDLAAHAAATGVPLSQQETPLQRVQSPRSTLRPDVEPAPAKAQVRDLDEEEDDLPVKNPPVMKPSSNANTSSTVSSNGSNSSSTSPSARRLVQPGQTLKQQLQQQQAPGLAAVPPFRAQPVPGEGLLYQSPKAPAGLHARETPWSVADFRVLRKLYAGYASSVYKAESVASNAEVVLKAYNLAGLSVFLRHQVLRELDIHSRLSHSGVVHLMAAFREGDTLVLVLEYVRGGSLDRVRRKLGGRMTEFQAMHLVLLPLLGTLAYLHGQGVVHRDIKPENCLFTDDWQLKLCDYGVSICLTEERAVTRTGSREYMAPEVHVCPLKRGPEDGKDNPQLAYGSSVDVWSLGAMMYELLVGFTPFPGGPPPTVTPAGSQPPNKSLAFPCSVTGPARDFVEQCLALHPGDRPTVRQLLAHPWVQAALDQSASPQQAE